MNTEMVAEALRRGDVYAALLGLNLDMVETVSGAPGSFTAGVAGTVCFALAHRVDDDAARVMLQTHRHDCTADAVECVKSSLVEIGQTLEAWTLISSVLD